MHEEYTMQKVNLHIVANNFKCDSRVLKETESIAQSGKFNKVHILALWGKGTKKYETLDSVRVIWRICLRTRRLPKDLLSQSLKYVELMVRIFLKFRKMRYGVVHCHDLEPLGVGVALKISRLLSINPGKIKVIYDAHELETERHSLSGMRRQFVKLAEKCLIQFADDIIVVSNSIGEWYAGTYRITKPYTVRNIPHRSTEGSKETNILKPELAIAKEDILFIYQGGLSAGRGIKRLLRVFSQSELNRHIVFMGFGYYIGLVKEYANRYSNIHFRSAVPPEQVLTYISGADVGIYLMENTCLNHYYSLPNKLFEIILSGLPIIISNLPEQRKVVEQFKCGWIAPEQDSDLIYMVNSLTHSDILGKKHHAKQTQRKLGWQKEEKALLSLYDGILEEMW